MSSGREAEPGVEAGGASRAKPPPRRAGAASCCQEQGEGSRWADSSRGSGKHGQAQAQPDATHTAFGVLSCSAKAESTHDN